MACDSYNRFGEDIALLQRLGAGAYRLSLSWPRIQPSGRGAVNVKGLDYYSRVIDALLEAGISPAVTLYHWDLPQELQDAGGWANRDVAGWFGDFAQVAAEAFGDRVGKWITLNEPWVVAHVGYRDGRHAPGIRDAAQAVAANHHLLLAHGRAVAALRASSASDIGITLNLTVERPATPAAAGHAAELEARQNGVYLDPIFRGRYPELLDGNASSPRRRPRPRPGRRPGGDRRAARLPRRQLLLAALRGRASAGRRAAPRRDRHRAGDRVHPARGAAGHRDELAGRAGLDP